MTAPVVEPGTAGGRAVAPVRSWDGALARVGRRFDPGAHRRVVVVAAHPDDETIGVGGCMQALHRRGSLAALVIASDGEAAFPGAGLDARRRLAGQRRHELAGAMAAQGLADVPVHWLGLPDSGLAGRIPALRAALEPLLAAADAYLAPWPGDPHPDHRAAGEAAAMAAPATAHGWSYPVWMWAWTAADDPALPWDRAHLFELDPGALAAKGEAIGRFASQTGPGPGGAPPVLPAAFVAHATRPVELLFREPRTTSAPVDLFARLYAGGNDPWRADSWYERRKRAVVLASLPRERYGVAFEPGCGTGALTCELSRRCGRVLASDPVPEAAAQARATARAAGVEVCCAGLPGAVPAEPVDLAVFSEVLYYLDDATVAETLDRTLAVLEPGGDVVAVHWRGWPAEAPRDAAATHGLLRQRNELEPLVEHVDEKFVLTVLRRR